MDAGKAQATPHPASLTRASLLALEADTTQTDADPPSSSRRPQAEHRWQYVSQPFPVAQPYGRRSPTPSVTSVSDEEEEEGYEERAGREKEVVKWADRKGKGRAAGQGQGLGEGGSGASGIAGTLPEEVLMHIFRLIPSRSLPSAMLVSRTWCVSAFPLLWSRPNITSIPQLVSLVRVLLSPRDSLSLPYHRYVRRLNLTYVARDLTDDLLLNLRGLDRVERLTAVGAAKISALTWRKVVDCMPELVALELPSSPAVDDGVLKVLGKRCRRLQGLHLSGCKSVGDKGIMALARGCKMLRRVKVAGCHRLTDESLIRLVRSCPLLLELDLANVPQLRNTSIYAIWLNSIHLRDLKLNSNANLTSISFPDIGALAEADDDEAEMANPVWTRVLDRILAESSTVSRDELGLAGEGEEENDVEEEVHQIQRRLRAMTVDSYSYGHEHAYHAAPPHHAYSPASPPLLDADIEGGSETGKGLQMHPDFLRPIATTFEYLRMIDLTDCAELEDPAIVNLIKNAPKLRNVTLAKCKKLTDVSLEAVAKLGKQLHYLHLGHLEFITDAAVTKIARSCTRLRYLDVASCPLLTDLAVFELASNLPKLRRIGLVKVVNLTDEGVYALAERHSTLERIHLSYCDNISVRAITFLLNRLLKLSHLSLTGVSAFKNEELQQFRKTTPPDFTEAQLASFCVYSQIGIMKLRDYLNTQQANFTNGSDTSTRRGSGSSASSVTLPAGLGGGSVWIGPAYPDLDLQDIPTSSPTASETERWSVPILRHDYPRAVRGHTRYESGSSSRRSFITPHAQPHQFQSQLLPQPGDTVYRRVSTPTLPLPPANPNLTQLGVRGTARGPHVGATTSDQASASPFTRSSQSNPRPRSTRTARSGYSPDIGAAFALQTPNFWVQQPSQPQLQTETPRSRQPRPDRERERERERDRGLPRIPGEYPSSRLPAPPRAADPSRQFTPVPAGWPPAPFASSGMGEQRLERTSALSDRRASQIATGAQAPPGVADMARRPDSLARQSQYDLGTSALQSSTSNRNSASRSRTASSSPAPALTSSTSVSTPARPPPPSAYVYSSRSQGAQPATRASTGSIYANSSPAPATGSEVRGGRERSTSGSDRMLGLAGRLRSPSIGDVGSPLRWVAEMVGWTGEHDEQGPRGERR